MRQFQPALGFALVVVLTVVSGVIHGRIRYRWGPPEKMQAVGKKLTQFPEQFGKWRLESSDEMSDEAIRQLECVEYFSRKYIHEDGTEIQVAVILGPAGPMSVHTPEVCFSSRAYTPGEKRQPQTIENADGSEDTFWARTFRSNDVTERALRVYYAWSTGGRWSAPDDARFAFAGSLYLYKVQLAAYPDLSDLEENDDPCRRFLEDFVPEMKRYLVDPSEDKNKAE